MAGLKQQGPVDGPYEHLLERLNSALDEADEMEVIAERPQLELELRGLTGSELKLIQAFLDRDLEWLRGWHAAAKDVAGGGRLVGAVPVGQESALSAAEPMGRAVESSSLILCCAICGEHRGWQKSVGVQVCQSCGSHLFRAESLL